MELIGGYTLVGAQGQKSFEVWSAKPTARSISKGDVTTVCSVAVVRITGGASGGGSGVTIVPLSLASGHSIDTLEIGANNGVPSASFEVDGTLYSAEEIGATFTTSWGQIEVIGINSPARTVTILHGDLQETLHVGQAVSK